MSYIKLLTLQKLVMTMLNTFRSRNILLIETKINEISTVEVQSLDDPIFGREKLNFVLIKLFHPQPQGEIPNPNK